MAKLIKKMNVCVVSRTYQAQDGSQKKIWQKVGEITTWQGDYGTNSTLELFMFPGTRFSLFEAKKKEKDLPDNVPATGGAEATPSDEIRLEDIPF